MFTSSDEQLSIKKLTIYAMVHCQATKHQRVECLTKLLIQDEQVTHINYADKDFEPTLN